jgi:hypothetical protein
MWQWWVFIFIHNCVWIFWFIFRNVNNPKKSQNECQWTTKHVFWQDYFLHIWFAPIARHFEPVEHDCFVKWLKKWVLCLAAFSFEISKLWHFCMIWFFIKLIQWTCTFIEGGMFLLYKKLKLIAWLYTFLLIPLYIYFLKTFDVDTL